jgi:hypothetical protein
MSFAEIAGEPKNVQCAVEKDGQSEMDYCCHAPRLYVCRA